MKTYSAKVEKKVEGVAIAHIKTQTDIFREFLSHDRQDGVRKAFYEVHFERGCIHALDTRALFELEVALYESQGYTEYRTIPGKKYKGIRSTTLHIFTHTDKSEDNVNNSMGIHENIHGEKVFDSVAWFFDYCPGAFDRVIAEVSFEPNNKNK
jgi:hypothetical protein